MAAIFTTLMDTMTDAHTLLVVVCGVKSLAQFLELDVVRHLHLVTVLAFGLKALTRQQPATNATAPTVCLIKLFLLYLHQSYFFY
jgi:hypothetical protein